MFTQRGIVVCFTKTILVYEAHFVNIRLETTLNNYSLEEVILMEN